MATPLTARFPDAVIVGDAVVLRPFTEDDVPAVTEAAGDALTQQWLPLPNPYSEEHAREFCTTFSRQVLDTGNGLARAIDVDGRLAGAIDLKHTDWRGLVTEIGYWSAPWARGRGFQTEAVVALSRWALLEQRFVRVEILVATENVASQRVAQKAGFVREGVLRQRGYTHTGRVDLLMYGLTRADLLGPASG